MASIIPGYNYDIFISYRQKDNKFDGWVTRFVGDLKKELEATFKEDISIYFDENPHDGLLEMHNVDKSLEGKLKSLIFIPIISQTYCDPKSFAWQHEFCAFNKMTKEDQFGRDIKLSGGNVTSRILPVKINDLDPEDQELIEKEQGGVLRSIEFIYKEPGVNRPLTPDDDEKKNYNNTRYRNQINKVANTIKSILRVVKDPQSKPATVVTGTLTEKKGINKSKIIRIAIVSGIIIVLFLAGLFIIPSLIKRQSAGKASVDKSIAVLPFRNDSPDSTNKYFIDGTMEAILNNLCKIADLIVVSRTSVEQFRNTTKTINEIAKRLNVNYILEGSGQKYGNDILLTVQLIDALNDKHIWSSQYEGTGDNIFKLQSQISEAIASELNAIISPPEKQLIEKTPTSNLTAHDFYLRGKEEQSKYSLFDVPTWSTLEQATNWYKKALEYDPEYAQAYAGLARIYWDKHYYKELFSEDFQDSAIILCDIALSFDNQLSEAYALKGNYYSEIGKSEQALEEFDKAIQYNPNDWTAYFGKSILHMTVDLVKAIDNSQKAASLNRGEQLPDILNLIGYQYMSAGFPEKAYYCWNEALNLDGDSAYYYNLLSGNEFFRGNFEKAVQYSDKVYSMDSTYTYLPTFISLFLGNIFLGNHEKSLKYLNKYLELNKTSEQANISHYNEWIFGYIFWKNGYKEKADYFFDDAIKNSKRLIDLGRAYAQSPEVYYDLAAIYAFRGETDKAFENLRIFSQKPCVEIKWGTLLKNDPLFNSIRDETEFQRIARYVEGKYQKEHERVRKYLVENNLI